MEAAKGCKKELKFTRKDTCPDCKGTGAKDASSVQTCPHCHGTGQVKYVQNTLFGQSVRIGACDKCHGTGKIVTNPCKSCNGKGVVNKALKLSVEIPAGVVDGSVLPISGQGNATQNGRNGNLNLVIRVKQGVPTQRLQLVRNATRILCNSSTRWRGRNTISQRRVCAQTVGKHPKRRHLAFQRQGNS